jgi:GWxTD domain-containing protein
MKITFLLIPFFAAATILAQSPREKPPQDFNAPPVFYYDIVCFLGDDSLTTKCDVFVQVPFNRVFFVKEQDVFKGEYQLTVSVYNEDKSKLLQERSWSEKLQAADFHETLSKTNFNISRKSFNLRPAAYNLKIIFEDKDSKKSFLIETAYKVRAISKSLSLSDPILIGSAVENSPKVLPNVSGVIQSKDNTIPVFLEAYSDSARSVYLTYAVSAANGAVLYNRRSFVNINSGKTQIVYTIDSLQMDAGEYTITISLLDTLKQPVATSQKRVSIKLSGLPFIIRDLDKAIDQMVYFASTAEIDSIRRGKSYDDKLRLFQEFWKRKDPNEATEENEIFNEYYRRVEYANKNFQTYAEGWRTDMGMVYIILGPPNNIERHPFEYDSKPYEVWEYYELNRRYIFIDSSGFGDYRLITPLYGEENRLR